MVSVMAFGQVLLAELELRGISQAELARRLELTPQAVTNWVRGHAAPSRDTLARIEDALGLIRGQLFVELGYRHPDEDPGHLVTPEEAIRLDPQLTVEAKRALLHVIAALRNGRRE
jgi:transcriptional regulator with XRE-family HTH domain